MALFRQQAAEVDIIISTALIPGKKAPLLITKDMVESMQPGSVTVDLAAEFGGNIATTVAGKVVNHKVRSMVDTVHGTADDSTLRPHQQGVTCIGYTDLPSRMAKQASTLYSNNISKFLMSMGPFTGHKGHLYLDDKDDAVRGALVLQGGALRWPAPPLQVRCLCRVACVLAHRHLAASCACSQKARARRAQRAHARGHQGRDHAARHLHRRRLGEHRGARGGRPQRRLFFHADQIRAGIHFWVPNGAQCVLCHCVVLVVLCPGDYAWYAACSLPPDHPPLAGLWRHSSPALASHERHQRHFWPHCGRRCVLSNTTTETQPKTGLMCMTGGLVPTGASQLLASSAVLASAINIGGGFMITQRMLDMFKRPGDPPEFNQLYAIPAAATVGTFALGSLAGFPEVTNTAYLAARWCHMHVCHM